MSTGKLKWYNAAKGFGSSTLMKAAMMCLSRSHLKKQKLQKLIQDKQWNMYIAEHKGKPVATQLKVIK